MTDFYIFREPPKDLRLYRMQENFIYCGFMNVSYTKKEQKERIEKLRKKYKNNIIWIMKSVKGFSPLKET